MDIFNVTFLFLTVAFVIHCVMTRDLDGLFTHMKSRPLFAIAAAYYLPVMFVIEMTKKSMPISVYDAFVYANFFCSVIIFYYLSEYLIRFAFDASRKS